MHRLIFAALFLSIPLQAASPVLIPTLYSGPGSFGSRWGTIVVVNNFTDAPFSSPGVTFGVICSIPEGCFSDSVGPGQFAAITGPHPANGLIVYLPASDAPISFMARFASSPRNALFEGTELPIVREPDLSRRPIHLPDVPTPMPPTAQRVTLRIYAPDAQPGTAARVELRSWVTPTGTIEGSKEVALPAPPQTTSVAIFPG